MKNKIKTNQLGRTKDHKKSLLRNLANSLIRRERIKTTKAKAKELKKFIEPLITRAKEDTLHNRRLVFSKIRNKMNLVKLFEKLGPHFRGKEDSQNRPGGYTRRYLLGKRKSDGAEMVLIEFVMEEYSSKAKEEDSKQEKTKKK